MFGVRSVDRHGQFTSEFEGQQINNWTPEKTLGSGTFGYVKLYSSVYNKSRVVAIKSVKLFLDCRWFYADFNGPDGFRIQLQYDVPPDVYIANLFENKLPHGILDVYAANKAFLKFNIMQNDQLLRTDDTTDNYYNTWRQHLINDGKTFVLSENVQRRVLDNVDAFYKYVATDGMEICPYFEFSIFMDSCQGAALDMCYDLLMHESEWYKMIKDVAYQLCTIYEKTQMIFTDMKLENVLYNGTSEPHDYYVCDFGSFCKDGEYCVQTFKCPFEADGTMGVDPYYRTNKASQFFGIWSMFLLLELVRNYAYYDTNYVDHDIIYNDMMHYTNMDIILSRFKKNEYVTPYVDSIMDFVAMVVHPYLFNLQIDTRIQVNMIRPNTLPTQRPQSAMDIDDKKV